MFVCFQGDVELPSVPSDELPDVPAASEKKPGTLLLKLLTIHFTKTHGRRYRVNLTQKYV